MSVIHKYCLRVELGYEWEIQMPGSATFLAAQEQDEVICMWFKHENGPLEYRRFRIVGTGHTFNPEGLIFLATVQMPPYVWHVFEMQEPRHDR